MPLFYSLPYRFSTVFTIVEARALSPSELGLDNIKLVRLDNGLVAPFDPILLDLALVDLPLFIEEINRIALLERVPTFEPDTSCGDSSISC